MPYTPTTFPTNLIPLQSFLVRHCSSLLTTLQHVLIDKDYDNWLRDNSTDPKLSAHLFEDKTAVYYSDTRSPGHYHSDDI